MSKLKELEKRLRDEPDNLGLRVLVAGAMREAGRQAEAVELYRSVAMAYLDQGRAQQAIAVCKSILEIAPTDARCISLLAALTSTPPAAGAPRDRASAVALVIEADLPPATPRAPMAASVAHAPAPPVLPTRSSVSSGVPNRRSSFDETPLPRPVPYHVHDPTTHSLKKLSEVELPGALPAPTTDPIEPVEPVEEDTTRPTVTGLASAAHKISASLIGVAAERDGLPAEDLAAQLDTRQRPRIAAAALESLSRPPPTVPIARVEITEDVTEDEELDHPDDEQTKPRDLPGIGRQRPPTHSAFASPFFAPLPAEHRAAVLQRFSRRAVTTGTTVIRQGEHAHPLVLVARGRLDVRAERADGKVIQVGTIGAGEYVGEAALLARTPAAAHVIAATDAEILLLPPRDFYEVAGAFPALWAELKDVAERRTREHDQRMRGR